ncbi:UDP-glucose 4-epimerase GalE [Pengzhenrongella sp.]|jgi:UDP-glucose 4-epimerase|uniref:UDP-glucose 4-epimerase GalE n=1 Tax=Pengzhenrongella sp. TaxID=2888820 RepID=UPI002F937EF2
MTVLVTGGAGYIGAHVVKLIRDAGGDALVVDDFSTGLAARVPGATIVRMDLSVPDSVERLSVVLREHDVRSVIHLAAKKRVDESMALPAFYFRQNISGLANVLLAMQATNVDRLVFSSSAAVYGSPATYEVTEDAPLSPENPYGQTKLVGEWLVRDAVRAWGLRAVSLRYFNVAGAGSPELGDPLVMNLVTMLLQGRSLGQQPKVFGGDYPTRDGSCVRDFVHVRDVARAHLASLDYLSRPQRPWDVFNVGTGTGSTVLEVTRELAAVSGWNVEPEICPRRPGDPASVVASVDRIAETMAWRAENALPDILSSAWTAWQHDHPNA